MKWDEQLITHLYSAIGRFSEQFHLGLEVLDARARALESLTQLLLEQVDLSEVRQVWQQVLNNNL